MRTRISRLFSRRVLGLPMAVVAAGLLILGIGGTGGGFALAANLSQGPQFCVEFGHGTGASGNVVLNNWDRQACPSGTYGFNLPAGARGPAGVAGATGPQGPAGPAGLQGPQGPAGTNGTNGAPGTPGESLVSQTDLATGTMNTGGPFSTGKTTLATVPVPNGIYRVSVNEKVANVDGQTAQVYPLVAVYDGAALSDFSNDLFNLGEGALPPIHNIDQYISGSEVVKVTSGSVVVYGFGYDSDRGAGTYTAEGGIVTIAQVTAAT